MKITLARLSATFLPVLAPAVCFLTGCGTSATGPITHPGGPSSHAISGSVRGGQQPVVGSSIALYAAGKTGLYSAPRSMLTSQVATDANGNFDITGRYTCQTGDQVYLVATGGNPGAGTNASLALMAALGPCSALSASTFITVNEVTTVASAFALSGFMTGVQALGANYSVPSQANALAAAFANVKSLADVAQGTSLQTSTGNGIVPLTTIHSLANSIATCVNSASSSSSCATLFS